MRKIDHNKRDESSEHSNDEACSMLSSSTSVGSSAVLGRDTTKRSKFKARLPMIQWATKKGLRRIDKTKEKDNKTSNFTAPPCCGVSTANDKEIQTEKQFSDKSVQCDEAAFDYFYRSHPSSSQRGTTIVPINERLDIINTGHHLVHHGGCNCCCVHHYGLPMSSSVDTQPTPRTPLHDARRRSLEQSNVVSVFPYGDEFSSEPVRLFRKNNLNARSSDSGRSWMNERQDQTVCNKLVTRSENRFGSSPILNSVPTKSEDRSKKNAYRKIGRVSPFVTHKEEEDKNEVVVGGKEGKCEFQAENGLPTELEQQAYLVLGLHNQTQIPFRRKICTPFNKRISLPPEHFKQWPSESKFEVDNDSYRHSLPSYDANRFDGSQSTAALHPVSHTYPISSAVDSNSIMFRSNADHLHELDGSANYSFIGPNTVESSVNRNSNHLRATPSLYSRLSGSIQNLFVGGRDQSGAAVGGARSDWSKSENNLSELSRRRGAVPRKDRLFFFGSRGKVRQRRSNNFNTSGGGSFFTYNYDDEEESRWKRYFNFKMNLLRKHNKGKVDSGNEASKRYV